VLKINKNNIKHAYNKIANYYDIVDRFISPEMRSKALQDARGKVLEVGIGTGGNLKYYPTECKITGVDLSQNMLQKAKEKANALNLNIELYEMDIESLQFADETFDTVVAT
jgi:ubiquinone/menaquinone biosynthesis C-methylase UbiE